MSPDVLNSQANPFVSNIAYLESPWIYQLFRLFGSSALAALALIIHSREWKKDPNFPLFSYLVNNYFSVSKIMNSLENKQRWLSIF